MSSSAASTATPGAYQLLRTAISMPDGVQNLFLEVDMAFQAFQDMWAGKKPDKLLLDPGFVITQANLEQGATRCGATWSGRRTASKPEPASAGGASTAATPRRCRRASTAGFGGRAAARLAAPAARGCCCPNISCSR